MYSNLTIPCHSNIICACDIVNQLISHATVDKRFKSRYLLYPCTSRAKADLAFIFKEHIIVGWRTSCRCTASKIHPQTKAVIVRRYVRF